jgi:hypothetical protein
VVDGSSVKMKCTYIRDKRGCGKPSGHDMKWTQKSVARDTAGRVSKKNPEPGMAAQAKEE